jgi:hypothetical protein
MSSVLCGTPAVRVQIERILESAVVLSWEDLVHPSQTGLIQIEYAAGARLPYLKIWQLTARGEWRLVCEYWMARVPAAPDDGMMFGNDYHSAGLAEMLEFIMEHQESFVVPVATPATGLILVTPPTNPEKLAARACMRHAYECFGLTFARIPEAVMA